MTVVIVPSRCLRYLLASFGATLLAAALAVGVFASQRFAAGPVVAAALLFAGLCVLHGAARPGMAHRIDISGPGQLRLTVQQDVRLEAAGAMPVALLPGSTLWPRLMLLRFGVVGEGANGARYRVAVLPDSVSPQAFRALAVALGASAGPVGVSSTERKIL